MRVVVVGAGFAGLTCARLLRDGGADVVLLEGGRRTGGRARTVRRGLLGGRHVETGAEWVDTHHRRMLALLERYGLRLEGAGQQWTTLRRMLIVDGRVLGPEDVRALEPTIDDDLERYEAAFEAVAAGIADPSAPELHPEAARHDARSMADVARDVGLAPLAALVAARASQGEFAAEQREVSSLFVAQQRAQMAAAGAHGVVRAHRVVGGLGSLVERLTLDVGDVLAAGEAVEAVDWDGSGGPGGVTVHTPARSITADHVVLACSLVAVRAITFRPGLPPALAAAVAGVGYGTVTKTAVQFARRSWPSGYATTSSPVQRLYEATVDQPPAPGHDADELAVLMAYTGGDGGRRLAELDEAARIALVADDVRTQLRLDPAAVPIGATTRAWSTHPRYGGAYAAYGPGQVTAHWRVLREPCGPILLAGEHVATWTGYLEGAVESGEAVAARLLHA